VPVQTTYPGVYIEEIPSGVRTIVGVATSITAFIGRARRGPVDIATDVFSFDAFSRTFGGLWADSALGYAVRDFFLNGGSHAVIVRLGGGATVAKELTAGGLTLRAADPGSWGAELRLTVTPNPIETPLSKELGTPLFSLQIRDTSPGGDVETIQNVSFGDNHRNVAAVLKRESQLVQVETQPATAPTGQVVDSITQFEQELADARKVTNGTPPDPDKIKAAEKKLRDEVDRKRAAVGDGKPLTAQDFIGDTLAPHTGLHALDAVDLFNLLCIPPHRPEPSYQHIEPELVAEAAVYCEKRRAMMIVDPHENWKNPKGGRNWLDELSVASRNAALFFPRLRKPDPERAGTVLEFAPCGAVAGVFARTDAARGVWKAPAGLEASLVGVPELSVKLDDDGNGQLNPLGINCLRSFPVVGRVVWGSRTLVGADVLASEWKYVPVRRLALFIEESLFRGTQWVVFEPNDEPLWAQIRLNVGAFMQDLFRQGAFAGASPREAFAVRCDKETTTPLDQQRGVVNILVQFAPLRPAEFVVIRLQQLAGQTGT
jgi:uncharacterized protein